MAVLSKARRKGCGLQSKQGKQCEGIEIGLQGSAIHTKKVKPDMNQVENLLFGLRNIWGFFLKKFARFAITE